MAVAGTLRAQEGHGSKRLKGRHIAGTGHDHVGITDIVAGPSPNTRADGAVVNGRINVEPLPLRLFAGAGTLDHKAELPAALADHDLIEHHVARVIVKPLYVRGGHRR